MVPGHLGVWPNTAQRSSDTDVESSENRILSLEPPNNFLRRMLCGNLLKFSQGDKAPCERKKEFKSANGCDVAKQAIIDVNSFVSGRNYDILTSIIAQLMTSKHCLICAEQRRMLHLHLPGHLHPARSSDY